MIPRATMRLQLHGGFTFADAERLVPYFSKLGVSHIYASPITTARRGSMHGYDVIDPTSVGPELGGEEGLRSLVASLRVARLGLIVDIVPNHMAIGADNPWWSDVLKSGRDSRFAIYFDIDWETVDPNTRGKILLPVLGEPYSEALSRGDITLRQAASGDYDICYFEQRFPVAERDRQEIAAASLASFDPRTAAGRQRLEQLLARQHYRLAWWRSAADEINWRRFFDVNELAALRMEEAQVFEHVHALIFRLYAEGVLDGVRVDHIDGLAEPGAYCRALRQRFHSLIAKRPETAPQTPAYLVVEKILLHGEQLPRSWQSDGTSGYDFMDEVNLLQHDQAASQSLAETWAAVSGRPGDFSAEESSSRRQILEQSFNGQLAACARAFHRLAHREMSDASVPAITRCLREVLVHFGIYRTYGPCEDRAHDAPFLLDAFREARNTVLPSDKLMLDRLQSWLSEPIRGESAVLQRRAVTRFQQLSAPLAAKAVEDTAAYRYGRLISRNDVGFDLQKLGATVAEFHAKALRRHREYPHALLATATHDHKRGEDVRARLAVISELPELWRQSLADWIERSAALRQAVAGSLSPTPGDIAISFQTIVGSWPLDLEAGDDDARLAYAKRLADWQQKALREAKLETNWIVPNSEYEAAARSFLMRLVADRSAPALLDDVVSFARRIAPAGAVNGLAQALIKLTAPGVPDLYQGTEYWDLSLVDPDNRRPVDFAQRIATLETTDVNALVATWRNGAIKQHIIARTLELRRKHPKLFSEGSYEPVEFSGAHADHAFGFMRRHDKEAAIVIVPRLVYKLLASMGSLVFQTGGWADTSSRIDCRGDTLVDLFTGDSFDSQRPIPLQVLFGRLPVALLVNEIVARG